MIEKRARAGTLIGLAAAAGAFGAAATMSLATAPTARADDTSEILAAIENDYAIGQSNLTSALADFDSGLYSSGLANILNATNEYTLAPTDNLLVGSVEALEGDPITSSFYLDDLSNPGNFTNALAEAQILFNDGEGLLSNGAIDLAAGDYGAGTYADLIGADYAFVLPVEELLLGALSGFDIAM
jgi:hypothetical protein